MPSKYPVLPPRDIIKALSKLGFEKISQKGSHAKYRNKENPVKSYMIPMHKIIDKGTLKSILAQVNITIDEFKKLL